MLHVHLLWPGLRPFWFCSFLPLNGMTINKLGTCLMEFSTDTGCIDKEMVFIYVYKNVKWVDHIQTMISHRQGFVYGAKGSHPPNQKSLSNTTPSTHPMFLVKKKTWPSQQTSTSPPQPPTQKNRRCPLFVYPIHPHSAAVHLPPVILALWQGSKGMHQNLGTHCWSNSPTTCCYFTRKASNGCGVFL